MTDFYLSDDDELPQEEDDELLSVEESLLGNEFSFYGQGGKSPLYFALSKVL